MNDIGKTHDSPSEVIRMMVIAGVITVASDIIGGLGARDLPCDIPPRKNESNMFEFSGVRKYDIVRKWSINGPKKVKLNL